MKIDRVLLATNNNPTYYEFWNPLSKLYKTHFDIQPTLIFSGSEEELRSIDLSTKYGDVIRQDIVSSKNVQWTTTWLPFYYTKLFPNEVCLTNGIDQIPLGSEFLIDIIKGISQDKYVMLIDNAYQISSGEIDWRLGGKCPSAYHVAKGSVFNSVYKFSDTFQEEIAKIESLPLQPMWENYWGLDEAYSSNVLFQKQHDLDIIGLSRFETLLDGKRIDCHRELEVPFDVSALQNNMYVECHACRPYSKHYLYLDDLINNIPKFI
jgi:hypothetical protein